MNGNGKAAPLRGRVSLRRPCGAVENAKALALSVEEERRKIGQITFAELNSPDTIHRIRKLEQLINQYMRMTTGAGE